MQGTRKDAKGVYERGPALAVRRKVVLEQHAVKGIGGCAWKSKTGESSMGWVIREGFLEEGVQMYLSPGELHVLQTSRAWLPEA